MPEFCSGFFAVKRERSRVERYHIKNKYSRMMMNGEKRVNIINESGICC